MVNIYHLERNGKPFYVGYTSHPIQRKSEHRKTYGKDINLCVIEKTNDYLQAEEYWIEQYRQWGFELLNKNKGGGGMLGKRTDDDIKKYHYSHISNNREKYNTASKKWQSKNKLLLAEYDKEYNQRPEVKIRKKEYYRQRRSKLT